MELLSQDIICELARYLSGGDVLALHLCGCRALTAKLRQTLQRCGLELPGFASFPYLAFSYPLLQTLSVKTQRHFTGYPFNLRSTPLRPISPHTRLTKLVLAFRQSLSILSADADLPTYCPNLQDLEIRESATNLTDHHLRLLPRGLIRFAFSNFHESGPLPCEATAFLPRGLEHLEMIVDLVLGEGLDKLQWPTGLKSLELSTVEDKSFIPACLLPSIEVLKVWYTYYDNGVCGSDGIPEDILPMSQIPKTLRIFDLIDMPILMDAPLPPNLIDWRSNIYFPANSPVKQVRVTDLPPSVTNFVPGSQFYSNSRICDFPDGWSELILHKEYLQQEPLWLPKYLKELSMLAAFDPLTVGMAAARVSFPATLRSLYLKLLPASDVPLLPPNLTTLSVGITPAFAWSTVLGELPKSLGNLFISLHTDAFLECYQYLPPTITTLGLTLYQHNVTQRQDLQTVLEHGVVWPKSLETLQVTFCLVPWFLWMRDLRHMTKLTTLILSGEAIGEHPMEWLRNLPSSLEILRFPATHHLCHELNCLDSLPSSLRQLCIIDIGLGAIDKWISPRHLRALPPKLTSLQLPDSAMLSPDIVFSLPSGILDIDAYAKYPPERPQEWKDALKLYYDNPKWFDSVVVT